MSTNSHNTHKQLLVGADVGGTKVSVLVVDSFNNVLGQANQPTALTGSKAVEATYTRSAPRPKGSDQEGEGCGNE